MRQLAALVRFPDTTTEANIIKEFNQPHTKLTAACFQSTIQLSTLAIYPQTTGK